MSHFELDMVLTQQVLSINDQSFPLNASHLSETHYYALQETEEELLTAVGKISKTLQAKEFATPQYAFFAVRYLSFLLTFLTIFLSFFFSSFYFFFSFFFSYLLTYFLPFLFSFLLV
jgi:hypothetical protein